jgi:hypothetical protein
LGQIAASNNASRAGMFGEIRGSDADVKTGYTAAKKRSAKKRSAGKAVS